MTRRSSIRNTYKVGILCLIRTMPNKKCEMPDCVGDNQADCYAVRSPGGELQEMCEACLDDGWRGVVTVLDG